jgi:hypothetical protein
MIACECFQTRRGKDILLRIFLAGFAEKTGDPVTVDRTGLPVKAGKA